MKILKFLLILCFPLSCEINNSRIYYWAGEFLNLKTYAKEDYIPYTIKIIGENGVISEIKGKSKVKNRDFKIKLNHTGINIINLPSKEIRILVLPHPEKLNKFKIKKTLPNTWEKLISKKEYTILAMGDSVTATFSKIGGYEKILSMFLEKVTGNKNIRIINRSYPGRSVDAAVRNFKEDVEENSPDLCLLMYGLNDEGGCSSLATYLEQYHYIGEKIKKELKKDIIFLQPTPHIDIKKNPPNFIFRTIVFAESLKEMGDKLNIPVAETFHYLWSDKGKNLYEIAKNMWFLYPKRYSEYFSTLIETDGEGDTIHPNILGHLKIAQSVYDAINGKKRDRKFQFEGYNEWDGKFLKTHINIKNISEKKLEGEFYFYPPHFKMKIQPDCPVPYSIKSGEKKEFKVVWSEIDNLEKLLNEPYIKYIETNNLYIVVLDFNKSGNGIYVVKIPFSKDFYIIKERYESDGEVNIKVFDRGRIRNFKFIIPEDSQIGREKVILKVDEERISVGEIIYVKYGIATEGESIVGGNLEEWKNNEWLVVGEKSQVGWPNYTDYREDINECYTLWAFKKGERGIYIGIKASGEILNDRFTLFFDPREKRELGKVGKYYWVSGSFGEEGKVYLLKGETTKKEINMSGRWERKDNKFYIECFIPYEVFDRDNWAPEGDIGVSIWWSHKSKDEKITNIYWSEPGHPWTPKWYGVIRLVKNNEDKIPYMVRLR